MNLNESCVIGVDHGYYSMKTPHFVFPTGVVAHDYEPYTRKGVLEYGGKYYVVGSGRQPLQKNKTLTDDYYLMTLAALAKEIELRNLDRNARIHLAVGIPLTNFGREKGPFRKYLLRDRKPVSFRFEGVAYTVTLTGVTVCPQGYAALSIQSDMREEPSVIVVDWGNWPSAAGRWTSCGWTTRVPPPRPAAVRTASLEKGMILCLDEIMEQVRRTLGLSLTAAQIESVLRGDANSIPEDVRGLINEGAKDYVRRLLSAIMECGMDYHATPTVFLGGGAALMKRYAPSGERTARVVILDDVCLNAKAYERIARKLLHRNADG